MIAFVLVAIILMLLTFGLSLVGKRLELFSSEVIKEHAGIFQYFIFTWLIYFAIGLVWFLGKVHFPGVELMLTYGFDNKIGYVLRPAYWKSRVSKLGRDVLIDVGVKVLNWSNISIDDRSWIDRNVILIAGKGTLPKYLKAYFFKENKSFNGKRGELIIGKGCHICPGTVIQAIEGTEIGDYTAVAAGSKLYSFSNHYRNLDSDDGLAYSFSPMAPPEKQSYIGGPIVLEENSAVGLNSVVLPGVTIGKNSWVGVCSYVIEDIPANSIAIGCPAHVVRKRNIR